MTPGQPPPTIAREMVSRPRILLVDDEPINLELFDVMLSKLGFEIEKAVDGEDGLEKVRDFNPHLIILDNIMPGLTGWEVTKKLKTDPEFADYRSVAIIMFSAMDEVQDKVEGFSLGIDDYITKPFNFAEVLARIQAVLHRQELADQVTRREQRIDVMESLNGSLIGFSRGLRERVAAQLAAATLLQGKVSDSDVAGFIDQVASASRDMVNELDRLKGEVQEMGEKEARLKRGDMTVEQLEDRLRDARRRGNSGDSGRGAKQ